MYTSVCELDTQTGLLHHGPIFVFRKADIITEWKVGLQTIFGIAERKKNTEQLGQHSNSFLYLHNSVRHFKIIIISSII